VGYVRPHDIEISRVATGEQTLLARVSAIHPVGGSVRVDLEITVDGQRIEAEIRRDQFLHLALQPGDAVFITPHNVRVFAPEI
jgi:sulfate transport system ATP-binding protein